MVPRLARPICKPNPAAVPPMWRPAALRQKAGLWHRPTPAYGPTPTHPPCHRPNLGAVPRGHAVGARAAAIANVRRSSQCRYRSGAGCARWCRRSRAGPQPWLGAPRPAPLHCSCGRSAHAHPPRLQACWHEYRAAVPAPCAAQSPRPQQARPPNPCAWQWGRWPSRPYPTKHLVGAAIRCSQKWPHIARRAATPVC